MINRRPLKAALLALLVSTLAPGLMAENPPATDAAPAGGIAPKALFDPTTKDAPSHFAPSYGADAQVTVAPAASGNGVDVTVVAGTGGYPGVVLKPQGATSWDFSPWGDVQATITNTNKRTVGFNLRVDNEGDWHESPWSNELAYLKAGETRTIKTIFGYTFGKRAYALKPNAVTQVMIFLGDQKVSGEPVTFHIESVEASGSAGEKPPVDPSTVRLAPPGGLLVGPGVTINAAKQLIGKGGATGSVVDSSLKLDFPAGTGTESVTLKPEVGKWDLREYLELRVKLRNTGPAPVTPGIVAGSNGGNGGMTDTVTAAAPIAPGAEAEIVLPFASSKIWSSTNQQIVRAYDNIRDAGTGNNFTNNSAGSVTISVPGSSAAQSLVVESIKADQPPYSAPEWLGKRPPVEGEWTKTFDDEFDGTTLNEKNWRTDADNFWDTRTHFTREEVIMGGGKVTLHYEKKTGFPNDDPTKKPTAYAAGYLDTYGKWVQRYGYFESRFKLPKALGLWPAFWLVPERGPSFGPFWARENTGTASDKTTGMEFDITEFLSGWSPCRYNIAMHWDGYGKEHKAAGQTTNYVQPDKDGYITAGLLWLPGEADYYCNGKEILHFVNPRVATAPAMIIYNFVSGGWDNLPLDDAKLPDDFVIQYIRVWQRRDLASAVDGYKTEPAPTPAPSAAAK